MRKAIALVFFVFGTLSAIDNYNQPQTFTAQQVLTSDQLNTVVDTPHAWTEKLCDTLNRGDIARYSRIVNDSTFDTVRVNYLKSLNTMRGDPDIDSAQIGVLRGLNTVRGNPDLDSAQIQYISGLAELRGNPDVDSLSGSIVFDTITGGDVVSVSKVYSDSLKLLTYAETLSVDDSLYAAKIESPNINLTGALSATTVNTGQGDNELYAMDQNVLTTSNVTFADVITDSLDSRKITVDTLGICYNAGMLTYGSFEALTYRLYGSEINSISGNIVTKISNASLLEVLNEGAATRDTVDSIYGIHSNQLLFVVQGNTGDTTVFVSGKNIVTPTDGCTMAEQKDVLILLELGTGTNKWGVASFQDND